MNSSLLDSARPTHDMTLSVREPSCNSSIGFSALFDECCKELPLDKTNEFTSETLKELKELRIQLPQALDMESLLEWESSIYQNGGKIYDVLTLKKSFLLLDPESVALKAGIDPLLWANFSDADTWDKRPEGHKEFLSENGHDTKKLEIARVALWCIVKRHGTTREALSSYEIARAVEESSVSNFKQNLSDFVKSGKKVSAEFLADFDLEGVTLNGHMAFGRAHS